MKPSDRIQELTDIILKNIKGAEHAEEVLFGKVMLEVTARIKAIEAYLDEQAKVNQ